MSKKREKVFYENAKRGCVLIIPGCEPEEGRITWTADYTFGWLPASGRETMVFKGPGLRITPTSPSGDSTGRGQQQEWREQKSRISGGITSSTGSRRATSRDSGQPADRSEPQS